MNPEGPPGPSQGDPMLPYQMTAVLRETTGGSMFVSIPHHWGLDASIQYKVVLINRETGKQIVFCKSPASRGSNLVFYAPKKLVQAMFDVGKLVNVAVEPLEEGERWPDRARAR